jgi:hypothetical protein
METILFETPKNHGEAEDFLEDWLKKEGLWESYSEPSCEIFFEDGYDGYHRIFGHENKIFSVRRFCVDNTTHVCGTRKFYDTLITVTLLDKTAFEKILARYVDSIFNPR